LNEIQDFLYIFLLVAHDDELFENQKGFSITGVSPHYNSYGKRYVTIFVVNDTSPRWSKTKTSFL